ncbi:hypothetical protein SARC_01396 [Sphaeroforma arctica JP610]|uniref:Uncharacterized protein n=1 Tax=Sphaeroforma arctica JP610 TaxID=667725 RepID=A0A0L0GBR7_9EUKA|nr:hypothetical protein SARC_01396 [Sphaeroforma arctica JP610]KNC86440.1 hypothetical protein SARC_01396 [Sphaeroforma arctica JP610]|eukprot:XP_014160342.1 hypothetical protein SARC_01396 [Sphaeroforma arctica JP610]
MKAPCLVVLPGHAGPLSSDKPSSPLPISKLFFWHLVGTTGSPPVILNAVLLSPTSSLALTKKRPSASTFDPEQESCMGNALRQSFAESRQWRWSNPPSSPRPTKAHNSPDQLMPRTCSLIPTSVTPPVTPTLRGSEISRSPHQDTQISPPPPIPVTCLDLVSYVPPLQWDSDPDGERVLNNDSVDDPGLQLPPLEALPMECMAP